VKTKNSTAYKLISADPFDCKATQAKGSAFDLKLLQIIGQSATQFSLVIHAQQHARVECPNSGKDAGHQRVSPSAAFASVYPLSHAHSADAQSVQ
jgi:hypothetical protein